MRKKVCKLLLFVFALCPLQSLWAQPLLTLEEAVNLALENNFRIRIARNDARIDETNNTIGNAGMLPSVAATYNDNRAVQSTEQTRLDGTVVELDNARNNNRNYGVSLGWTIFDGFGMFVRHDQLRTIEALGTAELQLEVLTRVSEVMALYFDIAQQQQVLRALDSTLVISRQRVSLAENRYTIGKASKLEVLNAQVDLNTDQTTLLQQQEIQAQTKIRLNELLAREVETDFRVQDEYTTDENLQLGELQQKLLSQNPQIQAQVLLKRIAELELKNIRSERYPSVNISAGYIFTDNESGGGFISQSQGQGFNYGLGARLNLFDGRNLQRREQVAKIQIETSQLLLEEQQQVLQSRLAEVYQTYLTQLRLISLEQSNTGLARENMEITMEKHRIGTIPTIEYRTAQLNYVNAQLRLAQARYRAKLSEIRLRELSGTLTTNP